jgi:acyl-CoA synthetase (AMP-forming)/AMP-acid ligase II
MRTAATLREGPPAPAPPTLPLGHLLLASAERHGDGVALLIDEEQLTYRELVERAWDVARSLAALGIRPGDHVGLLMPNCVDFVASLFGISLLGGVVVPINTRYRSAELGFLLRDADLKALLTSDIIDDYVDFVALIKECLPGLAAAADPRRLRLEQAPQLMSVVLLGERDSRGTVDLTAFHALAGEADEKRLRDWCSGVRLRDVACILYTSGTTANPRGAMLSHEAVVRGWTEAGRRWKLTAEDRFWNPCPMFHLAGLGPLFMTLGVGGTLVSDTYFRPEHAWELIARTRATLLYPTYPPITTALLNDPGIEKADLSSVRGWLNVAPPATLRATQARIPHATQLTVYGMTEVGAASLNSIDDDLETRVNTCGRPLPGVEIQVFEQGTSTPAGPSEPGELVLRGYNCFSGYYNDPEKTAATIDTDGWFHTGDLGTVDEQGQVMFLGRLKEMMKVGGENVAPAEIEAFVMGHPAVKLVQAVGIPDARLTEVPAIFVELKPGAAATEDGLIEFCSGKIASYRVPRHVRFVTSWPLSATKIQRFKLRDELVRELGL